MNISSEKLVQRFIKYVKINTIADEASESCPSTKHQLVLAQLLAKELQDLGLENVILDTNGYVYGTLTSNLPNNADESTVGLIAHMDTAPDLSGENVQPKIIQNYQGGDIVLNQGKSIILSPQDFPELNNYLGQDLITTDGTTLLGADDKAGIAEIISALEYLIQNPDIKHGTIKVAFTPDEEIGRGADRFDVEGFGANFAYTVDGGELGEMEYENFNAASAVFTIQGRNVHPGTAKNKMINSMLIANEIVALFPENETPAHTEGYEGFYHLTNVSGSVEETTLKYIIRDHDQELFAMRKAFCQNVLNSISKKYPGLVRLKLKDSYRNMKEIIDQHKYIVDIACEAMEKAGVSPKIKPIRGGTDGARLSFMGLPTPNIFTGGHNFHGKYEYIPIQSMVKAVETIVNIAVIISGREGESGI